MTWLLIAPSVMAGELAPDDGLPVDRVQEAALVAQIGPGAHVQRTAHFVVVYDTDLALVDGLTTRLEQTHERVLRFCETNWISIRRPRRRLEVLFFDDRSSYDRYAVGVGFASAGTYGAYFESTNQSVFFNVANDAELVRLRAEITTGRKGLDQLTRTLAGIRDQQSQVEIDFADGRHLTGTAEELRVRVGREIDAARQQLEKLDGKRQAYVDQMNRAVVQHEAAHQVLFNIGIHTRGGGDPKWLVEGLACLFEAAADPANPDLIGVNDHRLQDWRAAVAGSPKAARLTPQDYEAAVAAGRLVSLERLITTPALFDERGERAANHYAAVWALTYFLYRTQPDRLAAYIDDVRNRAAPPAPSALPAPAVLPAGAEPGLFRAHFGPPDGGFADRLAACLLGLEPDAGQ